MTGPAPSLPPTLAAVLAAQPETDPASVRYYPVLVSTNDTAAELAALGAPDGSVVIAGRQTRGRGRRGREWHSPEGVGLYLSMILRGRQSPVITLLAGVAVAEAIRETTGVAVDVKWPNDLVAAPRSANSWRKVAGILTEALPPGAGEGAIVGIGVNVGDTPFPSHLAGTAVALDQCVGTPVDQDALCAGLLARLARWRRRVATDGAAELLHRWRELSPSSLGAPVAWDDGAGATRRGITAGIDGAGALLVNVDGATERVVGGDLRWGG
ncbi:MAG: biotin--[acetyl-CoA-carboxylase] ligase [Acidobacteria bacterium]|nr:biotin--[acetyl-CoA-carboxylase] ligase [Acidobacteriota bacterium]MXZ70277.1 biotin--[acetyl-CoA-carboxylase] ligase [Acidobacteriota bacterium]MYJ03582.1 biotin--[acetyl-CoA-carboxylase] ligase [Acidobacteriota bacterium]